MISAAMVAGAIPSTSVNPLPIANNVLFSGSVTASTSAATTTCSGITGTTKNFFITGLIPSASAHSTIASQLYPLGSLYLSSTGTGVPAGTTVDCVDTTNNQLHMTAPATSSVSLPNSEISTDGFLEDGVFSETLAAATGNDSHYINTSSAITGCGTGNANCPAASTGNTVIKGIPGGWTVGLDAATQAAISSTPPIMGLAYGLEQNPLGDGYDSFTVQLSGAAGTAAPTITLTGGFPAQVAASPTGPLVSGDQYRSECRVGISAGPNGHLFGVAGVSVTSKATTGNAFIAPGSGASTATFTQWLGATGSVNSSYLSSFSDASIAAGAPGVMNGILILDLVSPNIKVMPNPAGTIAPAMSVVINGVAKGDPMSATIRIERCNFRKATQ